MSDDGHRHWARQNYDAYVRILVPKAFLDAHAAVSSAQGVPSSPLPLDALLLGAADGSAGSPFDNAVALSCPKELLSALAAYAESCMTQWDCRADYGHRPGTHIAAAQSLFTHVQHVIRREVR